MKPAGSIVRGACPGVRSRGQASASSRRVGCRRSFDASGSIHPTGPRPVVRQGEVLSAFRGRWRRCIRELERPTGGPIQRSRPLKLFPTIPVPASGRRPARTARRAGGLAGRRRRTFPFRRFLRRAPDEGGRANGVQARPPAARPAISISRWTARCSRAMRRGRA